MVTFHCAMVANFCICNTQDLSRIKLEIHSNDFSKGFEDEEEVENMEHPSVLAPQ